MYLPGTLNNVEMKNVTGLHMAPSQQRVGRPWIPTMPPVPRLRVPGRPRVPRPLFPARPRFHRNPRLHGRAPVPLVGGPWLRAALRLPMVEYPVRPFFREYRRFQESQDQGRQDRRHRRQDRQHRRQDNPYRRKESRRHRRQNNPEKRNRRQETSSN